MVTLSSSRLDRSTFLLSDGLRRAAHRYLFYVAMWIALILITFALQVMSGTYSSDLGREEDEPAHFITGLMVYDYVTTSIGSDPIAFAESYYLHYPKIAFGNWPPLFYVIQTLWYMVFGPTKSRHKDETVLSLRCTTKQAARILLHVVATATF